MTFAEEVKEAEEESSSSSSSSSLPIYLVTDAVKSQYTKKGYRSAFNDFLKTVTNVRESQDEDDDVDTEGLRALIDLKSSAIESKIIRFIKTLKERNLATSTIINVRPYFISLKSMMLYSTNGR